MLFTVKRGKQHRNRLFTVLLRETAKPRRLSLKPFRLQNLQSPDFGERNGNVSANNAALRSVQREPTLVFGGNRRLQFSYRLWLERPLRSLPSSTSIQVFFILFSCFKIPFFFCIQSLNIFKYCISFAEYVRQLMQFCFHIQTHFTLVLCLML